MNFSKASVKTGVRSAVNFSATLKPINNRCVFVIGVAILGGQKIHGKFTGNSRRFSRSILDWILGLDFERSENSRKIHRKFTEEIHRKIHRKCTGNSRGRQLKHFIRPGNPKIFVKLGRSCTPHNRRQAKPLGSNVVCTSRQTLSPIHHPYTTIYNPSNNPHLSPSTSTFKTPPTGALANKITFAKVTVSEFTGWISWSILFHAWIWAFTLFRLSTRH